MNFISAKNVALLVAAGLIATTGTAVAAGTASPTPKPSASAKAHTVDPAVTAYKAAMAAYHTGHVAADTTLKNALATAKATRDAAIAAATTADAKKAARDAFKTAVVTAKSAHDAAIAALGAKPTAPAKVAK
jgi:hypothetical protein